jgi:hypothetical protein
MHGDWLKFHGLRLWSFNYLSVADMGSCCVHMVMTAAHDTSVQNASLLGKRLFVGHSPQLGHIDHDDLYHSTTGDVTYRKNNKMYLLGQSNDASTRLSPRDCVYNQAHGLQCSTRLVVHTPSNLNINNNVAISDPK